MALFVDLETNTIWHGRKSERVWAKLAEFAFEMVGNVGRVVSDERMRCALWGRFEAEQVESPNDALKVYASHFRAVCRRLGCDATLERAIRGEYAERGGGYRLIFGETDPDAEFIATCMKERKIIERFLAEQKKRVA